jgi:hypothetical protein
MPQENSSRGTETRRFATIREAGEYYRISPYTVRRRIADGDFVAVKHKGKSRTILVDLDATDAALEPLPTANGAA